MPTAGRRRTVLQFKTVTDILSPARVQANLVTRTLLIDNYDSFTFNLYDLIARVRGRAPLVLRNDAAPWSQVDLADIDSVVISPGPGRPQVPGDLGISADAILNSDKPILGVCLGHQAIAHLLGGGISLANDPVHGRSSRIYHRGNSLFAGLPCPFSAVRYHSLIVSRLPPQLQATAWTEEGEIMALEHRTRPISGLQFHPESILTEHGSALIRRFCELAKVSIE